MKIALVNKDISEPLHMFYKTSEVISSYLIRELKEPEIVGVIYVYSF